MKRGAIELSFTMIFSLILIVFFVVAAVIGIKFVLSNQERILLAQFITDFEDKTYELYKSTAADTTFEVNIPARIGAVCFVNFSSEKNTIGLTREKADLATKAWNENKENFELMGKEINFFIYPQGASDVLQYRLFSHITIANNPLCFKNKEEIRLVKEFGKADVELRAE